MTKKEVFSVGDGDVVIVKGSIVDEAIAEARHKVGMEVADLLETAQTLFIQLLS